MPSKSRHKIDKVGGGATEMREKRHVEKSTLSFPSLNFAWSDYGEGTPLILARDR